MKIALVYPPCAEIDLKGYPLGLAYLLASLKRSHDVSIYNYNGREYKRSLKDFLRAIKAIRPDMVAISFNSFNRAGAYHIIKNVKDLNKDIFVVLGGVHPSTLYGQLFKYFYEHIDFIIQSEGEISLCQLCDALESGHDHKGISGLVYKDGKGGFVANPVSEIAADLDGLPIPDYSYAAEEIKRKGLAFLITSRGCPVNCSFCSTSSFWGQKVRVNSPERVGSEVELALRSGAKRLFFHDDTFNLGIDRTLRLAEVLKKFNVEYTIQARVKPVNEELIRELAESGCKHISWGVESLSDKILGRIRKGITKEDVRRAFDICAGYADKMTTSAYLCVGVPGETEETISDTVDYMNKYIKSTHGPGASMLYILPGTRIYQELAARGDFNESLWIRSGHVYYYTKEHSMRTLNRWRKRVNRSGIRIPFTAGYFWDSVPAGDGGAGSAFSRRCDKIRKKIKRQINLLCGRY